MKATRKESVLFQVFCFFVAFQRFSAAVVGLFVTVKASWEILLNLIGFGKDSLFRKKNDEQIVSSKSITIEKETKNEQSIFGKMLTHTYKISKTQNSQRLDHLQRSYPKLLIDIL